MDEHLSDFCPHFVGGIVTNMDILWEQELSHAERTILIRQYIDCLNRRGPVLDPGDVNLNGQASSRIPCAS